jgi:UDP-3-O-acyl N-acetylglucosamine deacetylase
VIKQRTIREPIAIEGTGLQTGARTALTLKPSPPSTGINFIRVDLPNKPLVSVRSLDFGNQGSASALRASADRPSFERRTTLGAGPLQVQTTEHLMAALSGLSIDNIIAEVDAAELPGLDGSAEGFVEAIKKCGIAEQDAPREFLELREAVWCGGKDNFIAVFPDDNFRVSYTMSYKEPGLGTQFFGIVVNEKSFENEIARARTFCLEEEALRLLKMGLGKGADYENTLVMGKSGPVKNTLRFPDEPVRHKILDLIGDLYLIGMPLKAHVVAIKSGHALNLELVKKLRNSH